jgi:hypothetical protein
MRTLYFSWTKSAQGRCKFGLNRLGRGESVDTDRDSALSFAAPPKPRKLSLIYHARLCDPLCPVISSAGRAAMQVREFLDKMEHRTDLVLVDPSSSFDGIELHLSLGPRIARCIWHSLEIIASK